MSKNTKTPKVNNVPMAKRETKNIVVEYTKDPFTIQFVPMSTKETKNIAIQNVPLSKVTSIIRQYQAKATNILVYLQRPLENWRKPISVKKQLFSLDISIDEK